MSATHLSNVVNAGHGVFNDIRDSFNPGEHQPSPLELIKRSRDPFQCGQRNENACRPLRSMEIIRPCYFFIKSRTSDTHTHAYIHIFFFFFFCLLDNATFVPRATAVKNFHRARRNHYGRRIVSR